MLKIALPYDSLCLVECQRDRLNTTMSDVRRNQTDLVDDYVNKEYSTSI